jgi:opacity protein-like surface antigen
LDAEVKAGPAVRRRRQRFYGYNFQTGSWVLGIEGDFSWSGIKKNFDDSAPELFFCTIPDSPIKCATDLRWLGTDRARLGYAWDRLLVYGTAGVAYGNVRVPLPIQTFLFRLATIHARGSYSAAVLSGRSCPLGR